MGRHLGSKNGTATKIIKVCLFCGAGKEYEPWLAKKINFCSNNCYYSFKKKNNKVLKEKICGICNKKFSSLNKYCSKECSYSGLKTRYNTNNPSPRCVDRVIVRCKVCRKEVLDTEKNARVVCSKACANRSFERRVEFRCIVCNKTQIIRRKFKTKRKYCSTHCRTIGISKSDTSIELSIEDVLKSIGITYIKQFQLGRFSVDFAIPEKKVLIECDGDYWHSLPTSKSRDDRKDTLARSLGWKMLRLTETQINKNIDDCKVRIVDILTV